MKKRSLFSRLGAMALAGVMAFESLGVMQTPITVHAAPYASNVPNTGNAVDTHGGLWIGMVDSDVYGTDSNNVNHNYNIATHDVAGYWAASGLNVWQIAHTPQGKSTFDHSYLFLCERGNNHTPGRVIAAAEFSNGYFKFDVDSLPEGQYIIVQDTGNGRVGNSFTEFSNSIVNDDEDGWCFEFNKTATGYQIATDSNSNTAPLTQTITSFTKPIDFYNNNGVMKTVYDTGAKFNRPLQNHPFYAGFSFNVTDKDLAGTTSADQHVGESQGDADLLTNARFAVFNISTDTDYGYSGRGNTSTGGYVIADRNNDGTMSENERKTFIPAYSISDINKAYGDYLSDVADAMSNGKTSKSVFDTHYNAQSNVFNLSDRDGANAIVPVMVLQPDANGVVKTSSKALPVGDYLILQISAGDGYYMDENFGTIVSIGAFGNDFDSEGALTPNGVVAKGGSAAYDNFAKGGPISHYNAFNTLGLNKYNADGSSNGYYRSQGNVLTSADWNNYNVAYCHVDDSHYGSNSNGRGTLFDLSRMRCADISFVDADLTGITNASYTLDDGLTKEGAITRLAPVVGQNKYSVHNTIIRGNDTFYLADNDDFNHIDSTLNVDADGNYAQISQGDGNLKTFDKSTVAKFTITNNSANPVIVNGKSYGAGAVVATYDVTDTADANKYPIFKILTDDLPYGSYSVNQVEFGEGYVAGDAASTLTTITVRKEDAITTRKQVKSYNGRNYITNQLVDGGELYEVTTIEGASDAAVDLAIYNISDHYVYVGDDRFETSKDLYELNIKGQDLTMNEVTQLLNDVKPCKVVKGVTPETAYSIADTLHYGSYLIVVTDIPDGYKLRSDAFGEDSVDEDGAIVEFKVAIEPEAAIPELDTVLVEASNKIDSVKVADEVALFDTVTVTSNLASANQEPKKYRLYGVIVDQKTGKLVPGQIATAIASPAKIKENALVAKATVDMYFPTMNTWDYEGRTFVAYEFACVYTAKPVADYNTVTTLDAFRELIDDTCVGEHTSLVDEDQTAYVPSMTITAEASLTHGKVIDPTETVIGTTVVGNLEPGNTYKLVSYLYDEAGEKVIDNEKNDKPLEVVETFTAVSDTKTCTEKFANLDASKYNNQRLTVYSTLYRVIENNSYELITKGDADSIGYDPSDETPGDNQVDVKCPTIKTVLTGKNGAKIVDFSDPDVAAKLTDTVTYTNLIVGGKYRSVLTLVDSTGMGLLDDNGKALTVTKEFVARAETQVVKLNLEFIATEAAGQDVIAYNDLYRVNSSVIKKVAEEHDLTSELQTIKAHVTVNKPTIVTVAKDSNTKSHTLSLDSSIIDTVNGMYLDPNTEYVLVTELAVNGAVFDRVDPIKTSVTTDENGKFTAKVTVGGYNAEALKGKKLTVFETLYNKAETKIICEHKDAEDENQTVKFGEMTTVAVSKDGKKEIACGEKVTIIDNIHYEGLTPGFTYTIKSQAMISSGGNGTPVGTPVNTTFTPNSEKGDVSIKMILDTTTYGDMDIVMFETITEDYSDSVVIEHKDISDASQTVHVAPNPDKPEDPDNPDNPDDPDNPDNPDNPNNPDNPGKPQTGVAQNFFLYFALAIVTFVGGIVAFIVNKRKKVTADK